MSDAMTGSTFAANRLARSTVSTSECGVKQQRSPAKKASGAPEALAVRHGDTANRSRRSQPHMTVMGDKQASVRSSVNMDYLLLGRIDPDHPEPGRPH